MQFGDDGFCFCFQVFFIQYHDWDFSFAAFRVFSRKTDQVGNSTGIEGRPLDKLVHYLCSKGIVALSASSFVFRLIARTSVVAMVVLHSLNLEK